MKKSIFLFFAAILCATSAWAYDMNSAEIYYDNTASQWSDVQLFVGKSDWNSINPMTKISNTNNLYCLYDFSWGGYSAFYFTTGTASWDPLANNENVDSRSDWATCRSAKQTADLGSTVNLYISTAATKGASVTRNTLTDYKSLNYKQTVQQQLTTDGSTYSASTEAIATIKVASYKLGNATTNSATANNGTITSGSSSANCEAARTATVTYTVSGINSAYSFVGWYNGDSQESTSATYTYQATEAKTITARFAVATEEEHEVAVSYMCGTTKVADGATAYVGVETEKSFTAPTNITGYQFTNWTIGAGMTLKTGAVTDATIGVVTKSASSDYTLVANYEEVMETVYFINTPKWTSVKAYAYSPENHAWPGVDATKEAEKIGDYDVYSYTATAGQYANVIFNGSGDQTADLTWTDGKYYIHQYNSNTGWYTKAEAEALLVVPVVTYDYYIAGPLAGGWSATQMGMEKVAEGQYTCEFTKDAGDYQFKVTNGKWGNETGGFDCADVEGSYEEVSHVDGNVNVKLTATTTFTVKFDSNTKKITFEGLTTAAPAPTYDYYIAGPLAGGWSATQMGMEKVAEGQYTCEFTKDAGDYQFKVTNGKWGNETGGFDCADVEGSYEEVSHVDGNVNVKLTSTTTFTVKFDSNTKKISFEGLTEKAPEPTFDYYITGSFNGDNPKKAENGMTLDGTVYKATVTLAAGENTLKVTDGTWEKTWGANELGAAYEEVSNPNNYNNIKITLAAEKEITVIFDATAGKITFEGLTPYVTPLTYTVIVPPGTEKCYIAGNMNGWAFQEMEAVTGETNKFTITIVGAKETDEYKYACQADWAYAEVIDGGGNRTTWQELDQVEEWGKPVIVTYQLKGVGGWEQPGIELVQNPGNDKEYMLTCQAISATDAIKVVRLENGEIKDYYGNGTVKDEVTVAVSYDGEANIKLPEGKYNFYFDTNAPEKKLWIEVATDCGPATITLTTGDNSTVIADNIGNTVDVVIDRSFTANDGYYTLCVPFNMPASVIGKAYSLGTITEHVSGQGININLEEESELSAGVPYLVLPKANMSELVVKNVTIQSDEAYGQNVTNEELNVQIFFEGFYSASGRITNGTTEYYVGNNGYLYNGEVEIRGLSGLFTITDTESNPIKVRARVVTREEVETGIDNNQLPNTNIQKVLENGQLIIIREGVKYNVQGQVIR